MQFSPGQNCFFKLDQPQSQSPSLVINNCMVNDSRRLLFSSFESYEKDVNTNRRRNVGHQTFHINNNESEKQWQEQVPNRKVNTNWENELKRKNMRDGIRNRIIEAYKVEARKGLAAQYQRRSALQQIKDSIKSNKIVLTPMEQLSTWLNQSIYFIFDSAQSQYSYIIKMHLVQGLLISLLKNITPHNDKIDLVQYFCILLLKSLEWYNQRRYFADILQNSTVLLWILLKNLVHEPKQFPLICDVLTKFVQVGILNAQQYRQFWQDNNFLSIICTCPQQNKQSFLQLLYNFYANPIYPINKLNQTQEIAKLLQEGISINLHKSSVLISHMEIVPELLLEGLKEKLMLICGPERRSFGNKESLGIEQENQTDQNYNGDLHQTVILLCYILYRQLALSEIQIKNIVGSQAWTDCQKFIEEQQND